MDREAQREAVETLWDALKRRCCATKPTDLKWDQVTTCVQVRKADLQEAMIAAGWTRPEQDGGWLPIESAPRDGTTVLLWSPEWEMTWGVQSGAFRDGEWITAEGEVEDGELIDLGFEGEPDDEGEGPYDIGPTVWHAIPEPPPPAIQEPK